MSDWTTEELSAVTAAEEVEVTPADADGAPLQSVVMWAVTVGDEVFVRSVRGTKARWWRHATASARGTFTAGDVTREVAFEPVGEGAQNQAVTDAYNQKYAAQPDQFRQPMVEGASLAATLRVTPV
ncbi:DUF2255 family protein [Gryllotalpicola reticulitermitis]|uniref:DUF2255 family protein n=1 Tax=Gryllotalpicola reticulitermitis TaxID=1184153 RepID=A0ABV8Q8T0_9MICO